MTHHEKIARVDEKFPITQVKSIHVLGQTLSK